MNKRVNCGTNRARVMGGAMVIAMLAGSASAQTAWLNAVNGSWFDASKWTAGVPGAATATTLGLAGAYTASLQNNFGGACGTLTISNPSAVLELFDNCQLNVSGNISNGGLIRIAGVGAPGNATLLAAAGNITHSGSGTMRLNALGNGDNNTAYLSYTAPGNVLTNAAGSTIAGAGRVYTNVNNQGTMVADQSGKALMLIDQPKSNSGTITASGGGFAQVQGIALTQSGAGVCLSSNGSPVRFANATVTGGGLNGAGTGSGIQYFGSNTVDGVTMSGVNAVTDNSVVTIGAAGVVNNGTWTVSDPSAPGNFTRIHAGANTTVGGTGTIRLQGIAGGNGDNDTAYLYYAAAANTLTNSATHSIKGYGRVYTNLVNNGTVNADVAGKGIFMIDQPKANNGTMTASNGGVLQFRQVTVTGNPTAQIISTDSASPVQMVNATMTGGGFTTSGTGLFQYFGNNTLSNLTVNGTHQIEDNSLVTIATDLVNNGTWLISKPSAPGNNTRMHAGGSVAINGTGTIRLQGVQTGNGDNDTAYLYYAAAGNVLTLGANQQLRGYGRVYTNVVNNGTLNADNTPNTGGPANKGIVLMDQPKTNNATITSSNGGWWYIRGITLTNNGTLTSANNSGTQAGGGFENCTVSGGTISNLANLFFTVNGATNINGSTLTAGSGLQVNDNSALNTTGITNNGTINVSTPTAPGNATRLQAAAASTVLSGTGTLRLQGVQSGNGDNDTAYLYYTAAANQLVNSASHSIKGYGRVFVNLVNNGTINADNTPNNSGPANKGIVFVEQPKTNNATITSSNGGWWYIRGITLTNNGTLTSANNSGTQAGGGFENCTVSGGTISNLANLYFGTVGFVNINGSTITAGSGLQVNDNSHLSTTGLTNNGEIKVQKVGNPGNATSLRANVNNATIAGTGTVRLSSTNNQANNDTAYLQSNDPTNFTGVFGPSQTLAGIGRVYHKWILNGTISPGHGATGSGEIQCQGGSVTFSPTTKYVVHANGSGVSGNYDRLTGNSSKVVDGQLVFSFEGGYSPSIGDKYDIVTGPIGGVTGEFDSVAAPSPFGRIRILYLEDRVRLSLCYGDCDGDGTLSIDDFICFQTQFALGDKQADCDEDGFLSIDDFICYQTFFAIGC